MDRTVQMLRHTGLGFLTLLCLGFSNGAYAMAGKMLFVNGEVSVTETSGKSHGVQKGDGINEGDVVATTEAGFAQIRMEDGGFFALRPGTSLKIQSYEFNGKEDGSERGVFSLIKGSMRAVTGLIGKKHRDNYKIETATATIGIRGSGADVGHSDTLGTAVRTLFGGHTLSSTVNGRESTIDTRPGQTALAAPGAAPKLVPSFPFSTATAPAASGKSGDAAKGGKDGEKKSDKDSKDGDKKGDKDSKDSDKKSDSKDGDKKSGSSDKASAGDNQASGGGSDSTPAPAPAPTPSILNRSTMFLPIITSGGLVLSSPEALLANLATGIYIFHSTASFATAAGQYARGEFNTINMYDANTNFTLDATGKIIGIKLAETQAENASSTINGPTNVSNITFTQGITADFFETADESILIGRELGLILSCNGCTPMAVQNSHWIVAVTPAPSLVSTMTGSVNYTYAGSTHPTDAAGNVGTLNSAYLNVNFTTQKAGFGVNLTVANKTLDAYTSGTSIPLVTNGFEAKTQGGALTVNCTGSNCNGSGYFGKIGGSILGSAGASAAFDYRFNPLSDTTFYSDLITGIVALTGSAPARTASSAAPLGAGGATTGMESGNTRFNYFNVLDESKYGARLDSAYNLIAFDLIGTSGDAVTASAINGAVQDGIDATLGVTWGRWNAGYISNATQSGVSTSVAPGGSAQISFIAATHITTASELTALPSLGVITANYSMATAGITSIPTLVDGVTTGTLTSASATVNFSTGQITAFNVAGNSGAFGAWSASGSGSITDLKATGGNHGLVLNGSSSLGAITGTDTTINGANNAAAVGGFVGARAQGLISTISLTHGTTALSGAVYMKR